MKSSLIVTTVGLASLATILFFNYDKNRFKNDPEIMEPGLASESSMEPARRFDSGSIDRRSRSSIQPIPSVVSVSIARAQEVANEGNIDQAARILSELYARIDSVPNEDRATLLQSYGGMLLQLGSDEEAIQVLEQLLAIPDIDSGVELTSLKSLGEAYMRQEEWPAAAEQLNSWLDKSDLRDTEVLKDLSYTYYKQDMWNEAIPPAVERIDSLLEEEQDITRAEFMYLASLAYAAEDYENAAWVTQAMVNEFNEIRDWRNLMAILDTLGDEAGKVQLLRDAEAAGVIEQLEDMIAPRDRRRSRRS